MTAKQPTWRFKPPLLAVLATVLCVALFAGLGRWQIVRSYEIADLLEDYARRTEAPAVALPATLDSLEDWRFRRVFVIATPLGDRQFLLDNQVRGRQVGYNVLTPMAIAERDALVLIDRGWVPAGETRAALPDVMLPMDELMLEGMVHVPFGEAYKLGKMAADARWPRVVQYADFAAMGEALGAPVAPFILRLADGQPHSYQLGWPLFAMSPQKHIAYAVQWFAMALAVLVIFVALNLRRAGAPLIPKAKASAGRKTRS